MTEAIVLGLGFLYPMFDDIHQIYSIHQVSQAKKILCQMLKYSKRFLYLAKPIIQPVKRSNPVTDYEKEIESLTNYNDILQKYKEMKQFVEPTPFVYACLFRSLRDTKRLMILFNHCLKKDLFSNKSLQAFLNSYLQSTNYDLEDIYSRLGESKLQFTLDTLKYFLGSFIRSKNAKMIELVHKRMSLLSNLDVDSFVLLMYAHSTLGNSRAVVRLYEKMNRDLVGLPLRKGWILTFHDVSQAMRLLSHQQMELLELSKDVMKEYRNIPEIVSEWWDRFGWIEGRVQDSEKLRGDPTRVRMMKRAGIGSILEGISARKDSKKMKSWIGFAIHFDKLETKTDLYLFSELLKQGSTFLKGRELIPFFERYRDLRREFIISENKSKDVDFSLEQMQDALMKSDVIARRIRDWNIPLLSRKDVSHLVYALSRDHDVHNLVKIWKTEIGKSLPLLWSRIVHSVRLEILQSKEKLQEKLSGKEGDRKKLKEEMTYLNKQLKKGVPIQLGEAGVMAVVYTKLVDGWKEGTKIEDTDKDVMRMERLLEQIQQIEKETIETSLPSKNGRVLLRVDGNESDSESDMPQVSENPN